MFEEDVDHEETVDFSTGEVVEEKKQETDSKIENTQILDNAQDMLDDDKDSDILDDDDKQSDKGNRNYFDTRIFNLFSIQN